MTTILKTLTALGLLMAAQTAFASSPSPVPVPDETDEKAQSTSAPALTAVARGGRFG